MTQKLSEQIRPRTLKDVIGQKTAKQLCMSIIEMAKKGEKPPSLLFHGDPGLGKTTTAHALGNDLYGGSAGTKRNNFSDFNASMDRGIDIVRNQIIPLAKQKPVSAPFRILLLDEVEEMTPAAQLALKRGIEDYSSQAMFILTANNLERVIPALRSRCTLIHFKPLSVKALSKIAVSAGAKEKEAEKFAEAACGDARRCISLVEKAKMGVTDEDDDSDTLPDKPLLSLGPENFKKIAFNVRHELIVQRLMNEIVESKNIENLIILAEADHAISVGAMPALQVMACFLRIKSSKPF